MPKPVLALPCGSRSRISTLRPAAARAVPRLIAVVVLPTPPFWLARARTRARTAGSGGVTGDTANLTDDQDLALGIAQTRLTGQVHCPGFRCSGQFTRRVAALEE